MALGGARGLPDLEQRHSLPASVLTGQGCVLDDHPAGGRTALASHHLLCDSSVPVQAVDSR